MLREFMSVAWLVVFPAAWLVLRLNGLRLDAMFTPSMTSLRILYWFALLVGITQAAMDLAGMKWLGPPALWSILLLTSLMANTMVAIARKRFGPRAAQA